MSVYLIPIKYALLIFPFLAILITIPYILKQYHKYGSIHKLRVLIVYSFVLYLLNVFFLVIMPLPSRSAVANLSMAKYQWKLFNSLTDLWYTIKLNSLSIGQIIKNPIFYTTAYNILLTVPLGIYLRYYFKCSLSKTIFLAFSLSLFLEVTQLTGIFFIYPRNYRLFDVDDLFFNTLGSLFGYLLAPIVMKILPSRDEIDNTAYEMGKEVSFLRRVMAFFIDALAFFSIFIIIYITKIQRVSNFLNHLQVRYLFLIIYSLYYLFLPCLFKGKSLGKALVSTKITTYHHPHFLCFKLFIRNFILYFILLAAPVYLYLVNTYFTLNLTTILSAAIIVFIIYLLTFLNLFTKGRQLYEIISDTQIVSTIEHYLPNDEICDNIDARKGICDDGWTEI